MGDLSRHFSKGEFACRCGCGLAEPAETLIDLLEEIRAITGEPITITSGMRCPAHNAAVGGSTRSAHTTGHGCDIHAPGGVKKHSLVKAALIAGTRRVGVGKNFIHIDTATSLPAPRLWSY